MRNAIAVTVLIAVLAVVRASLAEINPSFGEAIRQNEAPPGQAEEEKQ